MLLLALIACGPRTVDTDPVDDTDTGVADRCEEAPTGEVSLPADDALHDEPIEWWYWTGHLQDEAGRWYGMEQTFFAMNMGAYRASSAHVALADLDAGQFSYDVAYEEGLPDQVTDGFALALGEQRATGGDGTETLQATFDDVGWDLDLVAAKPPVLQHGDGYHAYEAGGYTWYYSRQRIDVTGSVTVGGEERAVTGQAWFDHQWGDLLDATDAGWDWFAIQLDDGREIMLFLTRSGDEVIGGTYTDAGCNSREIGQDELEIAALGEWTSPHTGCTYPMGWSVRVGDLDLEVTPEMEDQELANSYKTYWEGASTVSGDATGRAYVELAGYCD